MGKIVRKVEIGDLYRCNRLGVIVKITYIGKDGMVKGSVICGEGIENSWWFWEYDYGFVKL